MSQVPRSSGGIDEKDASYKTWGVEKCPQCGITFDINILDRNPVREGCGHVWCRACFKVNLVMYPDRCLSCEAQTKNTELKTVVNKQGSLKINRASQNQESLTVVKDTTENLNQEKLFRTNEVEFIERVKQYEGVTKSTDYGQVKQGNVNTRQSNVAIVKPAQRSSSATDRVLEVVQVEQSYKSSAVRLDELVVVPRHVVTSLSDKKSSTSMMDAAPLPAKKKWKSAYIAEASAVTSVNVPETANVDTTANISTSELLNTDATKNTATSEPPNTETTDTSQLSNPISASTTRLPNSSGLHLITESRLQSLIPVLSGPLSSNQAQEAASLQHESPLIVGVEQVNRSLKDSNSKEQCEQKTAIQLTEIPDNVTTIVGPDGGKKYKCCVCLKEFKSKSHVRYHKYCGRSDDEKPFKCTLCNHGFVTKSHYEYHVRLHTGERPFACNLCNKGFNQMGKLNRHKQSHMNIKPFVCAHCRKSCVDRQDLTAHYLNEHVGTKRLACQLCKKNFIHESSLKKHIADKHEGPRRFVCAKCGKRFHNKGQLAGHLKTHEDSKQFKCDECDKSFTFLKDLRRHKSIHTDVRPFQCNLCSHAFRRKDNLDRHIRQTHCLNPALNSIEESDHGCFEGAESHEQMPVASTQPTHDASYRAASQKQQSLVGMISVPEHQTDQLSEISACPIGITPERPQCTEVIFQSPPISNKNAERKELCRILSFGSSSRRSVSDSESGASGDSGIEITDASKFVDNLEELTDNRIRIPVFFDKIKTVRPEPEYKACTESILELTPVRDTHRGPNLDEAKKSVTEICFTTKLDRVNERPVCTFVMNRSSQSKQRKSEAAACPWQLQSFFPR